LTCQLLSKRALCAFADKWLPEIDAVITASADLIGCVIAVHKMRSRAA
jgi:hypothetical protein